MTGKTSKVQSSGGFVNGRWSVPPSSVTSCMCGCPKSQIPNFLKESNDEFVERELLEVLRECLILGLKSLELLLELSLLRLRLIEDLGGTTSDSISPPPTFPKVKASSLEIPNEKESTSLSLLTEWLLCCRISTGISVPKVKLMSMHFSRSGSFHSSAWLPVRCFSSGDSPSRLPRLSAALSSISKVSEELELVTRAVRGSGTGRLTRTQEGARECWWEEMGCCPGVGLGFLEPFSFSEVRTLLQTGQVIFLSRRGSMQCLWKMWSHWGSCRMMSSSRKSSQQSGHLEYKHMPTPDSFPDWLFA